MAAGSNAQPSRKRAHAKTGAACRWPQLKRWCWVGCATTSLIRRRLQLSCPAHPNAITKSCLAVGRRLFKTNAPHLMLPKVVELESNISGSLGVLPIAVGRLTDPDQTSRYSCVIVKLVRALTCLGHRVDLGHARTGPVPDISPVGERLPLKLGAGNLEPLARARGLQASPRAGIPPNRGLRATPIADVAPRRPCLGSPRLPRAE